MGASDRRGGRLKKLTIAFYCWAKGYFTRDTMEGFRAEPTTELLSEMEGFPHVYNEQTGKMGIRIQRNLIPGYATNDFWEAVQMWSDWKKFGNPEAGGLNGQPCLWTEIIRLMESCNQSLKAE